MNRACVRPGCRAVLALVLMALPLATLRASEPTPEETCFVEYINRARANPGVEATRLGIALNEGVPASKTVSDTPKPPLAIDPTLTAAARAHATDMQTYNYFSHTGRDGSSPSDRCIAAGYQYYSGENLAYTAKWSTDPNNLIQADQTQALQHHDNLFIDKDYPDRGHRTNMLSATHTAVGVGFVDGPDTSQPQYYGQSVYSCTDFGRPTGVTYLCGVIHDDANGNGFYDVDEGMGNAVVTLVETGQSVNAWISGAYSLPVTGLSGSFTVRVSFAHTPLVATKTVTLGTTNVKVDFRRAEMADPAEILPTVSVSTGVATGGTLRDGATLTLALTTQPGSETWVDTYCVAFLPDGTPISFFEESAPQVGLFPYRRGGVPSGQTTILTLPVSMLPRGNYLFVGLVTEQDTNPLESARWKALDLATFTVE